MTKDKNSLNNKEKQEIIFDVKKAFNEAKSNFKNKNNNNQKKIIIPSIITILIISLMAFSWCFSSNPKTLFIHSTKSFLKTLNTNKNLSGTIDINPNIKTGPNELNKYNYKVDYIFNKNTSSLLWKTYEQSKQISEINFYNASKNYIYIPEINNNYISSNAFNYNYMENSITNAFFKAINGYKISSSKEVFKIDGKITTTSKTSLFLKNKDLTDVIDKISTYLNKNNYNENKITKLKNKFQNSDLEINAYAKGLNRTFVRLELIETKNNLTNTLIITKINNNKYYITCDKEKDQTNYKYMINTKKNKDQTIYDINIQKTKNNNIILDMNTNIRITKKATINIANQNINNKIDYQQLPIEQKIKINEQLKPIKMFIDAVSIK